MTATPISDLIERMLAAGLPHASVVDSVRALEAFGLVMPSRRVTTERHDASRSKEAIRAARYRAKRKGNEGKSTTTGEATATRSLVTESVTRHDAKRDDDRILSSSFLSTADGNREEKKEVVEPQNTEPRDDFPRDGFEQFWAVYPRKVAKGAARRKYDLARKSARVTFAVLMAGTRRYAAEAGGQDPQFVKHPATWLHAECWHDEPAIPSFLDRRPRLGRPMTAIELELATDQARQNGAHHDAEPSGDTGFLDLTAEPASPADRH